MTRSRSSTLLRPMPPPCVRAAEYLVEPFVGHAQAIVVHFDDGAAVLAAAAQDDAPAADLAAQMPCLMEFSTSGCRIMLGTTPSSVSGLMLLLDRELGPEPHDLDVQVLVDRRQLLPQRDEVIVAAAAAGAACSRACRISMRAVSGLVRTSDEIDASVLNRKCGLIWLVRASIRAFISSFSCSWTRCSMRALFQILIGAAMQSIVPRYDHHRLERALGGRAQ